MRWHSHLVAVFEQPLRPFCNSRSAWWDGSIRLVYIHAIQGQIFCEAFKQASYPLLAMLRPWLSFFMQTRQKASPPIHCLADTPLACKIPYVHVVFDRMHNSPSTRWYRRSCSLRWSVFIALSIPCKCIEELRSITTIACLSIRCLAFPSILRHHHLHVHLHLRILYFLSVSLGRLPGGTRFAQGTWVWVAFPAPWVPPKPGWDGTCLDWT